MRHTFPPQGWVSTGVIPFQPLPATYSASFSIPCTCMKEISFPTGSPANIWKPVNGGVFFDVIAFFAESAHKINSCFILIEIEP